MFRKTLVVLLALPLILAGGLTAAQTGTASKEIPGPLISARNMYVMGFGVGWQNPQKQPDSYRVSWTTRKKWRSLKKPNTKKAGNAIVTGQTTSTSCIPDGHGGEDCVTQTMSKYTIQGLEIPYSDTLRVRVRAIYKGEPNGPWRCCLSAFHNGFSPVWGKRVDRIARLK